MQRIIPLALALLVLVGYGVAEAIWTKRWFPSQEVEEGVRRLARVPKVIGDWEGSDSQLEDWQIRKGEISGYLLRRYVQKGTGKVTSVMIICGRARPTSQHPPELCYAGAGYSLNAQPGRITVPTGKNQPPAEFFVGDFQKANADVEPLRIYWGWNASGEWVASDFPRLQFARVPVLYKMYVIHPMSKRTEPAGEDPTPDFLNRFIPELNAALFRD